MTTGPLIDLGFDISRPFLTPPEPRSSARWPWTFVDEVVLCFPGPARVSLVPVRPIRRWRAALAVRLLDLEGVVGVGYQRAPRRARRRRFRATRACANPDPAPLSTMHLTSDEGAP